jgi:16S rRNA (uracil1498-N3)-methyltransferase
MQLFYSDIPENDGFLRLNAEESKHCKVLRKQAGDVLMVTDGKGTLFECRFESYKSQEAELKIVSRQTIPQKRSYRFHLYIAPTKQNERIEWMLEKCVEAGLDEITFIETERSEKHRINFERLKRIALSAMKQSGQLYLTKINTLIKLRDANTSEHSFIAHCNADNERKGLLEYLKDVNDSAEISVFIGPEGDFSEAEVRMMKSKSCKPLSLGNTRLRTETAGLYCAMVLNAKH